MKEGFGEMNIIRGGNDVDQINFKCLKVRPQVFRTCLGWGLQVCRMIDDQVNPLVYAV